MMTHTQYCESLSKEKQRMRTCLRVILMKIGDIPAAEISKYGISSLRKFLPEPGKARRIGTAR